MRSSRGRSDDALGLTVRLLRMTSEDFGHSTLPYVELTGNLILSETDWKFHFE